MDKEKKEKKYHWKETNYRGNSGGLVYMLGFVGAAFYYIQHAGTFWVGVIGVIKAFFWPALLIYTLFSSFHL